MRLSRVLATLTLLVGEFARADGAAAPMGMCTAPEKVFFACQTSQSRWISLCGNAPSSLQYRFGRDMKPELQYPERAADGVAHMMFARYSRYQTDRTEVRFENGAAGYVLFDYRESGKRIAGVRVSVDGGKSREYACNGPIVSRLEELQPLLRCDAESALNGGSCP